MNEGPFCGCVRITYDPVDLGDGSMAERWTCAVQGGCGREFVPKARASQAERSLATLRELIHTASGLDDHRYSAEQMVKEMAERWQGASDDCEKAEQALATVTAERDEAKYWLAAHKAASEALVDPVTGHGFFMLIGKGDDGADGWFYTFGGPLDSYTLCERSDDQDPHFVYFQRERYDHDRGCWIDGCEVVEPVLAPDECSVAPYCLEDVTEERDALKRERDEARAERDAAVDRLVGARVARESAIEDAEALRAQLAKTERVVEAARQHLRCDLTDTESISAEHALQNALRALDSPVVAGTDSGGSGAATPEGGHAAPTGGPMPPPEPAGISHDPPPAEAPRCAACKRYPGPGNAAACADMKGFPFAPDEDCACRCHDERDPQAPATRAEVEELRRRVERLEGG